ncbi:prolyl oligopeptidase family serine peptidase [Gordonia sp. NB41Y]|uniref:alpha/beta hydrolase family protein n=1 Tax=Gordonia sp. NB41Y TaxID=875808 RepID=UPI0006B237D5|nr:prolyl oligopeptidase family serine peptidase [Gordonia sp. NB41Y]EMP15247.2 esterase [Gordonia sp. NB41Y]WLP90197.1 prolyl oligopeptidase family serine peptidase [Gordonia sp. NB41Y]
MKRCAVHRSRVHYADGPSQFGHLYHAADQADRPEVMRPIVLVHGGYWTTEFALTIETAIARQYAERGALVWNIEYRRVGEEGGGWPNTGRDVVAAIGALDGPVRAGLDPDVAARVDWDAVAVVGHSAGGQLAVWASAQLGARTATTRIDTVVAQAAALDLVAAGRVARPSVVNLLGGPYESRPERYRSASPVDLEPIDAHIVVIHGDKDTAIAVEHSREYVRRVAERGQSVELIVVGEEGHDAFVDPRSACNRRTIRALGL